MTWMPKFRGTDEEEQERDDVPPSIPPAEAERLAKVPYSLKPVFTDDRGVSLDVSPTTVTDRKSGDPAWDAWVAKHPKGLDLGSNEKQIEALRASKRAVKNKAAKVAVGRPEMPEDKPRGFTSLAEYAPREGGVESVVSQTKVAPETSGTGGSGSAGMSSADREMLDAEQLANSRRTREGMYAAGRMIGRAGLAKNPQAAHMDAAAMASADEPMKFVMGQKAEARKKAEDARLLEDQGFQRANNARAEETQGFSREKVQRERDYNDEQSQVSVRRRAEALGLYPKEISRIPKEVFNRMTAADVDVLLKELNMQKDRGAAGASQRALLAALAAAQKEGKASDQYGEFQRTVGELEAENPGITTGKGAAPLEWRDKAALALPFGIGENLTSQHAAKTDRALRDLTAQLLYVRTGKTANEQEIENNRRSLGLALGQDPKLMSDSVRRAVAEIQQRQANIQSPYASPVWKQVTGGVTPHQIFTGQGGTSALPGPGRPPGGGGGKIKVSNGKEAMMIDPADEADAATDGFHRVR
jgi:hypothetical protein